MTAWHEEVDPGFQVQGAKQRYFYVNLKYNDK